MSSNIYDKQQKKLIPFAGNSKAEAGPLESLEDVNISSPTDGQALVYDGTDAEWKNVSADSTPTSGSANFVTSGGVYTALDGKVDKITGKGLSTNDYDNTEKAKVASAITNAVNDLVNYYLKSETYSKTEVDDIVTAIKNSRFEVVATLPTTDIKTNVIYLVPKSPSQTSNVKDEYINLNGTTAGWEKIGDTEIDLSNYVTTQALNTALADYVTSTNLTTILADYVTETDLETALAEKQDTLTFDNAPTENSNNPVKSGGIYADEKSIYEVMGEMGAKNLLPNQALEDTWKGITWKVNSDGTLSASGTATENSIRTIVEAFEIPVGKYILNGCPSGSGYSTYYLNFSVESGTVTPNGGNDIGEGLAFEVTQTAKITVKARVLSGQTVNIAFKPMIRLASITDDTYESYAKTNRQLTKDSVDWDNFSKLGAKNSLPNDAVSQTLYGITFTVNSDGSVTANGTGTVSPVGFTICKDADKISQIFKVGQKYILSGLLSNGNCFIKIATTGGVSLWEIGSSEPEKEFIYNGENVVSIDLVVRNRATLSNVTFYPMIRLASDTDSTYQPYAKTNRQLTEDSVDWDDYSELGAVNMCKNNAVTQTTSDGTTTFTWTVNDDKTVTVSAPSYPVTLASTQGLALWRSISASECKYLVGKIVKLTGCPSGGGDTAFDLQAYRAGTTDGSGGTIKDFGNGVIFNWLNDGSSNKSQITINIRSGYEMTGPLTFKPMITVPSYNGDYVPYAKSNRELTENVAEIVGGGAYVYSLPSYFYHIAITASKGSGQYIKLVTVHGEVSLSTSSSSIYMPNGQKVILNQANYAPTWTYSLDGLTANLNSTGHLVGYIISNNPVTFTVVDTSTPEANTLDTLNLALLSNS